MPQRGDLKRILILGSGPIVIGQACEFDYSGTQACKALRKAGYEIILINSNPASIMTDPEIASKTYIEPLTPEIVSQIILREKPDAILPTMGGQTALNLAVKLSDSDFLKKNNSEKKLQDAIYADERAIDIACRFGYSIPNAYKSLGGALKELIEKTRKKKKEVSLRTD